jgi:hypothetical protein
MHNDREHSLVGHDTVSTTPHRAASPTTAAGRIGGLQSSLVPPKDIVLDLRPSIKLRDLQTSETSPPLTSPVKGFFVKPPDATIGKQLILDLGVHEQSEDGVIWFGVHLGELDCELDG